MNAWCSYVIWFLHTYCNMQFMITLYILHYMRLTWISAIRCSDAYSDTMLGYANSIRTVDGGTHIEGIKASLTRTINNLGKKSKLIKVS